MNITDQIKQSIVAKFSAGQLFDKNDFEDVMVHYPKTRSSQALARLARDVYITFIKIEKFRNKKMGTHYRNVYQVSNKLLVEFNIKPVDPEPKQGTITKSHPMKTPPVRPGRYGVRFWDREKSTRTWRDGCWWNNNGAPLASCFVMEWWGVTR